MTTELLSWLIAPFCGRWGQITHWVSQVEGRANLQLIIMPYGVTHNVSFLLNWNLKRQRHTAHYAWRLAPYNCHSSITGALSRRFSGFVKAFDAVFWRNIREDSARVTEKILPRGVTWALCWEKGRKLALAWYSLSEPCPAARYPTATLDWHISYCSTAWNNLMERLVLFQHSPPGAVLYPDARERMNCCIQRSDRFNKWFQLFKEW